MFEDTDDRMNSSAVRIVSLRSDVNPIVLLDSDATEVAIVQGSTSDKFRLSLVRLSMVTTPLIFSSSTSALFGFDQ